MALALEAKKAIVAEVSAIASQASSAVIADYRGLTVTEMTELRKAAREQSVYLRVVQNTLARRAVVGSDFECIQDALIGPTVLAFSQDDPGAAARLLKEFAKQHESLEIKALSIGNKLLGADQIDVLANMPTYEVAIAQLMSVMKAPITKLVRTLAEPHTKLVRTIKALADSRANANSEAA